MRPCCYLLIRISLRWPQSSLRFLLPLLEQDLDGIVSADTGLTTNGGDVTKGGIVTLSNTDSVCDAQMQGDCQY